MQPNCVSFYSLIVLLLRNHRATAIALASVLTLLLAASAQAKQYVLAHPKREHCRAHYLKKLETVKKREHGKIVKVKETFCVYGAPQSISYSTPLRAPVPAPAPVPVPTPAPAPAPKTEPALPTSPLAVTASVWDPINTATEYETPNAGERFIAIELRLTNVSSATVSSDANSDTTVIGTNAQSYTATLNERRNCTDFKVGGFTLAPGAQATGCIVYELPIGVKVAKVQFGLNFNVEDTFSFS